MTGRSLIALSFAFLVFALSASAQSLAEQRIALVVTNQAYTQPDMALTNTWRDGDLVKAALEKVGFKVWLVRDTANDAVLLKAVSEHVARLAAAEPDAVGFLYYSGHGAADSPNGENYLIPTGAQLTHAAQLPLWAVPLEKTNEALVKVGRLSFVVFDACRSVPLVRSEKNVAYKGFVPIREQPGLFIAYATEPGDVAIDQNAYARALADELVQPDRDASSAFRAVARRVLQDTKGKQRPVHLDRRLHDFHFAGLPASALPASPVAGTRTPPAPDAAAGPFAPYPSAMPAWIVPVLYGTDRNRRDARQRIAYGNDRARRMELGLAYVTVPTERRASDIARPKSWRLPYFGTVWQESEDYRRHFTVKEIKSLAKAELQAVAADRLKASQSFKNQAFVFVHGHNMSFDDALFRTTQIAYDMKFDGAIFAYSWPTASDLTSYPYDRDSAQQAEPHLYEFIRMVQSETGAQAVNIIAHGMGNQPLLQVMRSLKQASPGDSKLNQIVLAAPDIDRDAFEFLAREISGIAKGITLYAATNDRALEASRIFAGSRPRAGDVPPTGPVIVEGVDTIDISSVSTSYLSLNHSGYAEQSELLTDLKRLFATGERPPELRSVSYKRLQTPSGVYWRYVN